MFPEDVEIYLVNEENQTLNEALTFNGRAYLFDYKKGDFVTRNGKLVEVRGKKAVEAWLEKLIRTEKFRFRIYEEDGDYVEYAVSIEGLIGGIWPKGFAESEIKREITEAAAGNPYIEELTEWSFERNDDYLYIRFTVFTVEGAFEMVVNM
ncbi:hypothetical protein SSIL_1436 [Solibacillus silvestris StLB046]|uniref:DUF2634 domain-containing protein n=1 Tax=Solibacillus silvestris (strain StLB046) TaxID=1002809 RepID=F2F2M1_SOLSS|nr:DUF2634 domain-containing protein [Solibacillus silvestris]BAK15859.1 hypothetical protein SSIL_1436 [Solibacillus silvestris StLB046]